jgi:hypothetical protein
MGIHLPTDTAARAFQATPEQWAVQESLLAPGQGLGGAGLVLITPPTAGGRAGLAQWAPSAPGKAASLRGAGRRGGAGAPLPGADVFSRQSDGTTIAAQYAKHAINLRCANTDRVNGWAEILTRFGDIEAGIRPTLFMHQRCARLAETLPALQHDPNKPEDVLKVDADEDGVGGDDAADALRYLVATKNRTITQRKLRGL